MARGDRDRPLRRNHVAAGEDAWVARHHVRADPHDPVLALEPGHAVEQRQVGLLAQREHEGVRLELLELARGLREAGLVERHPLDDELAPVRALDGREPLHQDSLRLRLLDLEVVSGHALARPSVDDDRLLGAEPLRGPRRVDRGVAAAVDDHPAPQHRRLFALHAVEQRDRVEDVGRRSGGDVRALAEVRPDGEKGCVEPTLLHRLEDARDLPVRARGRRRGRGSAGSRRRGRPAAGGTWVSRSASCRRPSAPRRRR